jgi:hypothetical protein
VSQRSLTAVYGPTGYWRPPERLPPPRPPPRLPPDRGRAPPELLLLPPLRLRLPPDVDRWLPPLPPERPERLPPPPERMRPELPPPRDPVSDSSPAGRFISMFIALPLVMVRGGDGRTAAAVPGSVTRPAGPLKSRASGPRRGRAWAASLSPKSDAQPDARRALARAGPAARVLTARLCAIGQSDFHPSARGRRAPAAPHLQLAFRERA